jgi:hypothetical protein
MPCNLFVVRKTERRKLGKVAVRVKEYRGRVWEKIRGACGKSGGRRAIACHLAVNSSLTYTGVDGNLPDILWLN